MNFNRKKSRPRRPSSNFIEDYSNMKWRMRGRSNIHLPDVDFSDDDDEQSPDAINWNEEFFGKRTESRMDQSRDTDQDQEVQLTRKQTLLLSTLVPDEILLMEKMEAGEPTRFVGVLLMADVSGYTALSERYNNTGKGGTYRLTVTLNTYLGALIELIYSYGGDIIKFAGDAFLACWKTDKRTYLCHTIHSVIVCALVIQHSYARYETDVKVNLRVKLAISAGNIMFSTIGTGSDMNYVVFGLPVMEAKLAESVCASGEVKLTPSAWAHCYSRNYDHIIHEDGHVTIRSVLYDPNELDVSKPFQGFATLLRQAKNRHYTAIENLPNIFFELNNIAAQDLLNMNETFNLRKTILTAEQRNMGSKIRNFMIKPVLTQIYAHQPLEYLTEMRQVSVLFVTLKPKECPPLQLITIVNNSYRITCEMVYKSMGCVNKIILFDKDVMILVIFGLRGYKHESEAQAALKCAYSIKKSVAALDGVLEVSIGVTTGQVYCGVVGHPLRREFTVIGAIVNKAARLMCYFRNKITCDEATFIKSKMSKNGFTLQPQIELKGIGQPGKIYEYTEEIRVKVMYNIPMIPPILDRSDEIEYFQSWISKMGNPSRDVDALLLIGESRIGKSRLIEWLTRISINQGFRVSYVNLTSIHSANPYLSLSQVIDQMLGLKEPVADFEKEQKIVDLLKVYNEELCYLNNILKVRFAYPEGIFNLDEQKRQLKARIIFRKLINCIPDGHIVLLDDLQNLDWQSWEFISIMLGAQKIFTVMGVSRGKFSSVHKWLYDVFIDDKIRKIVLGPLDRTWIPPLACQILDVAAVPSKLCDILEDNCKGMPGVVESVIVHLFSNGAIEVKKISHKQLEDYNNEQLIFPDSSLLKPQALNIKDQELLDELLENDTTDAEEISICIVADEGALNSDIKENNLDALIMVQIDSLTPYQQLLLKIGSVIGEEIPRELLENIMYENNPITTARAVKRLFSMRILACANSKRWNRRKGTMGSANSRPSNLGQLGLECDCTFDYDPDNSEDLPKYAFCKEMRFRNKNSRNTIYELLPLNQKKEFHTRVFNYLENNPQKCPECGGLVRILQSVSSQFDRANQSAFSSSQSSESLSEHFLSSESYNPASSGKIQTLSSSGILECESDVSISPRRSTKRVTMCSMLSWKANKINYEKNTILSNIRQVLEADELTDWHELGVVDSKDDIDDKKETEMKHFKVVIEKGISTTNFKKCACTELQILVYEQLVYHALQAELKSKAVEGLIEYSYLSLLTYNTESALERLEQAEEMCSENVFPEQDLKIYLGRIYSLKAACCLFNSNLIAAKINLEPAVKIYGLNITRKSRLKIFNNIFSRNKKNTAMEVDTLFCLNVASTYYNALRDEKAARTCALQAIKLIQRVDCRVVDMCDAFSNALQLEINRWSTEGTLEIEKAIKHAFRYLPRPVKPQELYSLGKMFVSMFQAKIARADLPSAVRSGYRSLVVSDLLYAHRITLDIVPSMFYLLIARFRIQEAMDMALLCFRLQTDSTDSITCETWFYALCMDLILDCGFQLAPVEEVHRFAEYALQKSMLDVRGRQRLVVNLWTYWLRMDVEKKAKKYEKEALSWLPPDTDCTLTMLLTVLRLIEGLLESLARKMHDLKKVVDLMELRSVADRELNNLEEDCRINRVIYCRWMRLKASSLSLSGRQNLATNMFNQAIEEGKKHHNVLEEALARAALSQSTSWLQNSQKGSFLHWLDALPQIQEHTWHHSLYRITPRRSQ